MMTFRQLKQGMRARITAIGPSEPAQRLREMGLTVGTEFRVSKIAPLGDPIEIAFRGQSLCMRRRECEDIELELVS